MTKSLAAWSPIFCFCWHTLYLLVVAIDGRAAQNVTRRERIYSTVLRGKLTFQIKSLNFVAIPWLGRWTFSVVWGVERHWKHQPDCHRSCCWGHRGACQGRSAFQFDRLQRCSGPTADPEQTNPDFGHDDGTIRAKTRPKERVCQAKWDTGVGLPPVQALRGRSVQRCQQNLADYMSASV